jgi:hypothetical protein
LFRFQLTPALADFVAIQLVLLSIGSSFSWSNGGWICVGFSQIKAADFG